MSEAKELDKLLELVYDGIAEKHYDLSIQAIDTMTAYGEMALDRFWDIVNTVKVREVRIPVLKAIKNVKERMNK